MGKKKVTGEDGKTYVMKEKKPFYKKVWFWILAIIVVAAIGGSLGGNKEKSATPTTNSSEKTSTSGSSEKTASSSSTAKEEKNDSTLLENFNSIKVGDILSSGDGGSTLEEVKAIFGEPGSQSETSIEGVTSKMMTWTGVEGGDFMATLVVSFSNDKAVSKAVTGLKVASKDKVTLDQFNAIATDGSFTEDAAKEQFGEPDGISSMVVNGANQDILTWSTNVNGDLGANFNVTFDNGTATAKANFGMK